MIGVDTRKWYELQEYASRREFWNHVIFEGDSKICIDAALDRSGSSVWAIEHLVSDICLFARSFLSCSFVWVNRSCNNAAHTAAKFAFESNVSCVFLVRVIFPLVWQLLVGKTPPFVSMFLSQYIADYQQKQKQTKKTKWNGGISMWHSLSSLQTLSKHKTLSTKLAQKQKYWSKILILQI